MPIVADRPLDRLPRSAVVAVAMSGGVDSSVVAARVAASGLHAFGVTLAMWPNRGDRLRDRGCCSVDAVDDARRVASAVGLAHYVWNMERDFEERVVREFENGYASGVTPNPCVRCNERIKFGLLLKRARAAGATHIATGHYARTGRRGALTTLHRATDPNRDQAYVLHRLDQEQLSRAVFPLGGETSKQAVRDEAATLGLVTAAKAESQDLCFVDGGLDEELRRRLAGRYAPGPVVDPTGEPLGAHPGLPFFTVGQRSGLGLATRTPDAAPRYVIEIRPVDNTVVVGPREALLRSEIDAAGCTWISGEPPDPGAAVVAQIRAHGAPVPATVDHREAGRLRLRLGAAAEHVAPGQSVVLFDGDEVLGGGEIVGSR